MTFINHFTCITKICKINMFTTKLQVFVSLDVNTYLKHLILGTIGNDMRIKIYVMGNFLGGAGRKISKIF